MRDIGLVEVENPSEYMLSGKPKGASGSVVACSVEMCIRDRYSGVRSSDWNLTKSTGIQMRF